MAHHVNLLEDVDAYFADHVTTPHGLMGHLFLVVSFFLIIRSMQFAKRKMFQFLFKNSLFLQVPAGNRPEMTGVNFQNHVKKRQMVSINLSLVTPAQAKGIIGQFRFSFEKFKINFSAQNVT